MNLKMGTNLLIHSIAHFLPVVFPYFLNFLGTMGVLPKKSPDHNGRGKIHFLQIRFIRSSITVISTRNSIRYHGNSVMEMCCASKPNRGGMKVLPI